MREEAGAHSPSPEGEGSGRRLLRSLYSSGIAIACSLLIMVLLLVMLLPRRGCCRDAATTAALAPVPLLSRFTHGVETRPPACRSRRPVRPSSEGAMSSVWKPGEVA